MLSTLEVDTGVLALLLADMVPVDIGVLVGVDIAAYVRRLM